MLALQPFHIEDTHGMLTQPGTRIRASSDGRSWRSLFASVQHESPFEGTFNSSRDQLLVLHRDGPVYIESLSDRKVGRRLVPAGGIHLVAPNADFGVRLAGGLESVHVYVRRAIIEEVALEMIDGDPAHVELDNRIVEDDRTLRSLIEASANALEDEDRGSAMFADFLSRAIAAQLIRKYSGGQLRGPQVDGAPGHLSPIVAEAIEYMYSNIDRAISLEDVAQATNRSPSHMVRVFRAELGMPPHRYLIALRVEKARRLLEKTSMSIAEIAYECGFAHQEHLTRLFRRHFNSTPAAYRRSKRN